MALTFNPFTGNFDYLGASAAVADGSVTNAKVAADAEIAVSKLADGAARQLLQTDAAGTDVEWTSNVDIPGTLDVTGLATFDGDVRLDDGIAGFTTTLQTITPTAARTISFPDATGTVALVGGGSGQVLWNNAGANAGASTLTYDGSILTSSGRFINSYNATASSPAKAFTGTWFTGGTSTTTKPQVLIEPTGATSTAWSTSGTGLGVNAASGFAGQLLDLQINGTSEWNFSGTVFGIGEANNIAVGTTTGTKIGTATTQKLGFWDKTPVVQPTTGISGATFVADSGGSIHPSSTFDGYTVAQVVAALRQLGILA